MPKEPSKSAAAAKAAANASYAVKDIVLGKVKGYSPWPGIIVDPENTPRAVQKERPQSKKYYCIVFFPTGESAWLLPADITPLAPHDIAAYIADPPKRANPGILDGYKVAQDPTKWLAEREAALAAVGDEDADADEAEEDELEEDVEEEDEGKKRKRKSIGNAKGAKKPRKSTEGSAKGKGGRKRKSAAMVESEDDGEGDIDGEAVGAAKTKKSPAKGRYSKDAAADDKHAIGKKKREETELDTELKDDPEAQKVKGWRHQLQKAFLSGGPKPDEMPAMDVLFTTVEQYEDIPVKYLQFSKIGKVLRMIVALGDDKLPQDDPYNFRSRAKALMTRFATISKESKAPDGDGDAGDVVKEGAAQDASTTNGAALPVEGNGSADIEMQGDETKENGINGAADESMALTEADITMSEAAVPEPLSAA